MTLIIILLPAALLSISSTISLSFKWLLLCLSSALNHVQLLPALKGQKTPKSFPFIHSNLTSLRSYIHILIHLFKFCTLCRVFEGPPNMWPWLEQNVRSRATGHEGMAVSPLVGHAETEEPILQV